MVLSFIANREIKSAGVNWSMRASLGLTSNDFPIRQVFKGIQFKVRLGAPESCKKKALGRIVSAAGICILPAARVVDNQKNGEHYESA